MRWLIPIALLLPIQAQADWTLNMIGPCRFENTPERTIVMWVMPKAEYDKIRIERGHPANWGAIFIDGTPARIVTSYDTVAGTLCHELRRAIDHYRGP